MIINVDTVRGRIISACAEQTTPELQTRATIRDHLRVCGADNEGFGTYGKTLGSSPRVRSRPSDTRWVALRAGDHLRVCGADSGCAAIGMWRAGSSPRVRSRRRARMIRHGRRGIISACAEQTRPCHARRPPGRDHLRVCGADFCERRAMRMTLGSSPRVRSRHMERGQLATLMGIISACAEQTTFTAIRTRPIRDHLRVCGADWIDSRIASLARGSSPRVRSRRRL